MGNKKGNNGNPVKTTRQHSDDLKDYSSFKIVLFYCSLIVFLPVATFFLLKCVVIDSLFSLSEIKCNIYSAIGAIVALHFSLALYIYRAYFGSTQSKDEKVE